MRPLYLAAGHMLGSQPPSVGGTDLLQLLLAAGTGPYDRWSTNMTGGPVSFPNRTAVDRLLRAQIGPDRRASADERRGATGRTDRRILARLTLACAHGPWPT